MLVINIDKHALQAQRIAKRKAIIHQCLADAFAFAGMIALFIVLYVVTPS